MKTLLRTRLLMALLVLVACSPWAAKGAVAKIDGALITREMVEARAKYLKRMGKTEEAEVMALAQFTQALLVEAVLRRYGASVSDEAVVRTWAQMQQDWPSDVSAIAAQVKDLVLQRHIFAFPEAAMQAMEAYFASLPIHAERRELALRLHRELMARPFLIRRIAQRDGLRLTEMWIGPNRVRSRVGRSTVYSEEQRQQASDLFFLLATTPQGKLYDQILDTPQAYQVFRVIERRPMEALVAILTIPKLSIDDWFWDQVKDVPVEFYDRNLGMAMLRTVPWGRFLNVKPDGLSDRLDRSKL